MTLDRLKLALTRRTVLPYILIHEDATPLNIETTRSKALKRLIENDDDREIRRDLVNRVRRILTALISAPNIESLAGPPGWRIHQLTGDRAGTWSISASGNWRITFTLDGGLIRDLDLEDYH